MQIPADPPSEDLRRPVGRQILPLVLLLVLLLVLPLLLPLVLPLVLVLVLPLVKISAGPPAVSLGGKRMDREIISPDPQKVVVRTRRSLVDDLVFALADFRWPVGRQIGR